MWDLPPGLSLRSVLDPPLVDEHRVTPVDAQRVVLLLSGRKTIESAADGRWRRAQHGPGALSLTAPGRDTHLRWRATSADPVRTLHLTVPGPTVRELAAQVWGDGGPTPVLDSLSDDDTVAADLLRALWKARSRTAPALYAQTATQFLLVHLLTRYGHRPEPAPAPGAGDRRISRVTAYMAARVADPIDLTELAAVAGLSPYHFLRTFRAHTGRTPIRYLADLRVETARRLLRSSAPSVTEVAYACGYSSPGHLSTVFRRATGMTPSQFRAQHRC